MNARELTLCVLGFATFTATLSAQTTTWTGANGVNWNDAGNWSSGLPSPTNDPIFDGTGTYPVKSTDDIDLDFDAAFSINSLTVDMSDTTTFVEPLFFDVGALGGANALTFTGAGATVNFTAGGTTTQNRSFRFQRPIILDSDLLINHTIANANNFNNKRVILTNQIRGAGQLTIDSNRIPGNPTRGIRLNANNTYTGGTLIQGGSVEILNTNGTGFGTGDVTTSGLRTSHLYFSFNAADVTVANNFILGTGGTGTRFDRRNSGGASAQDGNVNFTGTISGGGVNELFELRAVDQGVAGEHRITLSGANTFESSLSITAGNATNANRVTLDGSYVHFRGVSSEFSDVNGAGTFLVNVSDTATDLFDVNGAFDFSNITLDFSGAGALSLAEYVVADYTDGSITGSPTATNVPAGYVFNAAGGNGTQFTLTIPEPSSALLIALGIAFGLAGRRRR